MSYLSSTKRNIINFAALACIQFSNALLPLLAFPIVLNVVGSDYFSKIVVTEATALISVAIVLYSFDVEGISKIVHLDLKTDIIKFSRIYSSVLYIRLIIWLICLSALILLFAFIKKDIFSLLCSWMLLPLSYILHSYWLYQGLEKNIFLAFITLSSRLICLFLIIKLITLQSDYYLVPIIIGITYVVSGIISLVYIRLKFKIKLIRITGPEIKKSINDGKEIFFGNISVTLFRNSNVIILGLLSNTEAVSIYSIAEKAIKIFQAGARPLNQLFFPKVIRSISQLKGPNKSAFSAILKYTLPQLTMLSFVGTSIALIYILIRNKLPSNIGILHEQHIVFLISIMAIAVLFGISNYMFGMAGLNYLNRKKYFAKSIFLTGLLSIVFCVCLVISYSELGAAISFIFSEFFLFILITRAYFTNSPIKI